MKLKTTIALLLIISVTAIADTKPNVVYILADDLGMGDLSCYGQKKLKTPHIDRLSKEGMQFSNHYSGNTVCSPSRAVLTVSYTHLTLPTILLV